MAVIINKKAAIFGMAAFGLLNGTADGASDKVYWQGLQQDLLARIS